MIGKPNMEEMTKKALESPNIGKHGKRKITIAKEKALKELALKHYEQQLPKNFPKIVKVHFEEAEKPKNRQEREFLLGRVIPQAGEEKKEEKHLHLHQHGITPKEKELAEKYEQQLKELKT